MSDVLARNTGAASSGGHGSLEVREEWVCVANKGMVSSYRALTQAPCMQRALPRAEHQAIRLYDSASHRSTTLRLETEKLGDRAAARMSCLTSYATATASLTDFGRDTLGLSFVQLFHVMQSLRSLAAHSFRSPSELIWGMSCRRRHVLLTAWCFTLLCTYSAFVVNARLPRNTTQGKDGLRKAVTVHAMHRR